MKTARALLVGGAAALVFCLAFGGQAGAQVPDNHITVTSAKVEIVEGFIPFLDLWEVNLVFNINSAAEGNEGETCASDDPSLNASELAVAFGGTCSNNLISGEGVVTVPGLLSGYTPPGFKKISNASHPFYTAQGVDVLGNTVDALLKNQGTNGCGPWSLQMTFVSFNDDNVDGTLAAETQAAGGSLPVGVDSGDDEGCITTNHVEVVPAPRT
jgi:hypothetical protein